MDVILELTDTFITDYLYAWAHPVRAAPYNYPRATNASAQTFSSWEYKPASVFVSATPGPAAYMSAWPRDNVWRQSITLFFVTWLFGFASYYIFATLSYIFVFDKDTMKHPKFLKNQVWMEIKQANLAMPWMALMTTPFFLAEVRGYSKLYDTSADGPGRYWDVVQFPTFLVFTDFCIYWIHRGLHHPRFYKTLHKPHHKWIMPTPYASHAFHPVDGFSQSLPYHIFPFIFPLQKLVSVALFLFINVWTVMIHDGEYVANSPIINGAACHTMHHLYFNYNYGQYTTVWDRLGNSYRKPNEELFQRDKKMSESEWKNQTTEMEKMVIEVEGKDDRHYGPIDAMATKKIV